jgi:hypothetical protein
MIALTKRLIAWPNRVENSLPQAEHMSKISLFHGGSNAAERYACL